MTSFENVGEARRLSAILEAELVRELLAAWHAINYAHFREALRAPTLELDDADGRLGLWRLDRRTVQISRRLVLEQPWGVVLEVLKHEMAHQYAHEVLGAVDEVAHGPAFQQVCARLGIDPAASGMPAAAHTRTDDEARVLARIGALLALAESANEHEAQAAMSAAHKLMLKHNLAAAEKPRDYAFRHLGAPSGRVQESDRVLANILSDHFFVETIWVPAYRVLEAKRGSVLEICGSDANLEMAAYAYAFLRDTAARLWTAHRRACGIRGDRDRQKFVAGVMQGFSEKLRAEAVANKRAGLVWVRDGDLDGYFKKRNPRVRHVRFRGGGPSEAYAHGRAAGREIILHRPVSAAASSRGRLLGRLRAHRLHARKRGLRRAAPRRGPRSTRPGHLPARCDRCADRGARGGARRRGRSAAL